MQGLSGNCKDALARERRGEDVDRHVCLGGPCPCPCHHVPPPMPLRDLRDRLKVEEEGR